MSLLEAISPTSRALLGIKDIAEEKARHQQKLVERLPHDFFLIAVKDPELAIATKALVDVLQDGDWEYALKLTTAITHRLDTLIFIYLNKPKSNRHEKRD